MPTNEDYSEAYIDEKFRMAQRAGKSFVKNLMLIDLIGKVLRIEYEGTVYDVSAQLVKVEDINLPE